MDNFIGAASETLSRCSFFRVRTVALSACLLVCMNRDWFALPVQLSAVCVGVVHCKINATLVWLPSFVLVTAFASFVVGCACSLGVLVVVALALLIVGGGCFCSFVVGTTYVRPHRAVEPSTTEIDLDRADLKSRF